MAWHVGGVEEVSFKSSFEGVQGARIAAGSRYIVPGSRCRECKDYKGSVSGEVRRRMRPVECSGGARAQCTQRLLLMQLTRDVSRCSSVDGSECSGPELEVDTLTDRQPVQLPPHLYGTGTTWRLNNHKSERVLDTLKAVEVALRGAVELTVAVIDDTQLCVIDDDDLLGLAARGWMTEDHNIVMDSVCLSV